MPLFYNQAFHYCKQTFVCNKNDFENKHNESVTVCYTKQRYKECIVAKKLEKGSYRESRRCSL